MYFYYRIKSCLNKYFESTNRVAVYFERNILSAHFQLQIVPIPIKMADNLENMFKVINDYVYFYSSIIKYFFFVQEKFQEYNLKLVEIPAAASLRQLAKNSNNYFYIEFPNGKRLFHNAEIIGHQKKFPIHIARYVLY